jgi:hypothetical protein
MAGVVKTQWYDCWIQTNALRQRTSTLKVPRELDQIHNYLNVVCVCLRLPSELRPFTLLDEFEMPDWVARLPSQVGYPAGGSLTADEWKGLALVYSPIVVSDGLLAVALPFIVQPDSDDLGKKTMKRDSNESQLERPNQPMLNQQQNRLSVWFQAILTISSSSRQQ